MRRLRLSLPGLGSALLASLLCAGCMPDETAAPPELSFSGDRAFNEVEALVRYSPRDAGTPAGRTAAEHILQRLKTFGIDAELDTFTDQTPAGQKTMHNVIGRIPGASDQWLILGSHFDTMPGIENFQGANDSGSSTGVLLELARMLSETEPEIGIMFAFFDGEEGIAHYIPGDGLHGSRHLAQQLVKSGLRDQVIGMVLLDMVGDPDLHFTLPGNSSKELAKTVLDAAYAAGYRDYFSLASQSRIIDDHVPFLQVGIPAIDIIDFKYGSRPGLNDYWHTEKDNLNNLSAESLQIIGTVMIEMIKMMAF